MKKYISLMNAQSFYYIWQNKNTRNFILELMIQLNGENDYKLLDTFNLNNIHIRSHILLETNHHIYLVDFSHNRMIDKVKLNRDIINFLKYTTKREITLILFCNYLGKSRILENIHYIYRNNKNSNQIKLLMSKSYANQLKYDTHGIVSYLYSLDQNFYQKYLKELKNEENIYKLLDL